MIVTWGFKLGYYSDTILSSDRNTEYGVVFIFLVTLMSTFIAINLFLIFKDLNEKLISLIAFCCRVG